MASGGYQSGIPRVSGIKAPNFVPSRSRSQSIRPRSAINNQNAFGTQNRSSSVGGRVRSNSAGHSLGCTSSAFSRLSIAGRLSGSVRKSRKDTRPLQTKEFQKDCMNILKGFLTRHHFENNVQAITSKLLHGPSTNEFFTMFEFMYKCLSPNYQLNRNNALDQITSIVRYLRYPYNINRSHLMNPGSRQSWCHLLFLLCWMVDVIKYAKNYKLPIRKDDFEKYSPEFDEDFNNASLLEAFYVHISDMFKEYVKGDDRSNEEHKPLLRNLVEEYMGLTREEMESLCNQKLERENDLKQTEMEITRFMGVEKLIEKYVLDIVGFTEYKETLTLKTERSQTERQNVCEKIAQPREEIALKSNQGIKERLKQQECQGLNLKVLGEKKRQFRLELSNWEEKLKAKNEKKWNWEMEQLATHAQFQGACSTLEDVRLKLVDILKSHASLYDIFPEKNKLDNFAHFNQFMGDKVNSGKVLNMLDQLPTLYSMLIDHFSQGSWKCEEAIRSEDKVISDLGSQVTLNNLEVNDFEDFIEVNKQHFNKEANEICKNLEEAQENIATIRVELLTLSKPNQNIPKLEENICKLKENWKKIQINNQQEEQHYLKLCKDLILKKHRIDAEINLQNEEIVKEFDAMNEKFLKIANE